MTLNSRNQIKQLDDIHAKVYNELKNFIGVGPACFYHDACWLIDNADMLQTMPYLVAHCLRLCFSAFEAIIFSEDQEDHENKRSSDTRQTGTYNNYNEKLRDLKTLRSKLNKYVHRKNLQKPRDFDDDFDEVWMSYNNLYNTHITETIRHPTIIQFHEDAHKLMQFKGDLMTGVHLIAHCMREVVGYAIRQKQPKEECMASKGPNQQRLEKWLKKLDEVRINYSQEALHELLMLYKYAHYHEAREITTMESVKKLLREFAVLVSRIIAKLKVHYSQVFDNLDKLLAARDPDVKKLLNTCPSTFIARNYFYSRLANPSWLRPLNKKGVFTRLPSTKELKYQAGEDPVPLDWPEGEYLMRMASIQPETVREIIENLPRSRNPLVLRYLIAAVLNMPAKHSRALVPKLTALALVPGVEFIIDDYMAWAEKLVSSGYNEEAHSILRWIVLKLPKAGYRVDPSKLHNSFCIYDVALQDQFIRIARSVGCDALQTLCDAYNAAVRREPETSSYRPPNDFSWLWYPSIDSVSLRFDIFIVKLAKKLVVALVEGNENGLLAVVSVLLRPCWLVFWKIAFDTVVNVGGLEEAVDCYRTMMRENRIGGECYRDVWELNWLTWIGRDNLEHDLVMRLDDLQKRLGKEKQFCFEVLSDVSARHNQNIDGDGVRMHSMSLEEVMLELNQAEWWSDKTWVLMLLLVRLAKLVDECEGEDWEVIANCLNRTVSVLKSDCLRRDRDEMQKRVLFHSLIPDMVNVLTRGFMTWKIPFYLNGRLRNVLDGLGELAGELDGGSVDLSSELRLGEMTWRSCESWVIEGYICLAIWAHVMLTRDGTASPQRACGVNVIPGVQARLEYAVSRLNTRDISLIVTFGIWLPWLIYTDPDWVKARLDLLFPLDEDRRGHLEAALMSFLYWTEKPTPELYHVLRNVYGFAVKLISDPPQLKWREGSIAEKLAEHVAKLYVSGVIDLAEPLVREFYAYASVEVRCVLLRVVFREASKAKENEDEALIKRAKELWEWRLNVVQRDTRKEIDLSELAAFEEVLIHRVGVFDDGWILENLVKVARLVGPHLKFWYYVVEFLSEVAQRFPENAGILIATLLKNNPLLVSSCDSTHLKSIFKAAYQSSAKELVTETILNLAANGFSEFTDILRGGCYGS